MRRLVALAILCAALPAGAVPLVVTQQGRLLDGSDQPLTGQHTLSFALFRHLVHDPATPDPALWTGTYQVTLSDAGLYSVALGDPEVTSNPALDSDAFVDADATSGRFLEVSVDGVTLAPRLAVSTVPFAFVARSLQGGPVDAASLAVNGHPVVDANGEWVGGTDELDARYARTAEITGGSVPVPWSALTGVPTLVQAGDGLALGADGKLSVSAGAGLGLSGGEVTVRAGDGLAVGPDGSVGVQLGTGLVLDSGKVAVDFGQANLDAKYLRLDGAQPLTGALSGTSASFSGAVGAASVTATGEVKGGSVSATGAIDAASLSATGEVKGASLSAATVTTSGDATIGGDLKVSGSITVRPAHASVSMTCAAADEGTLFFDPTAKTFFGCIDGKTARLAFGQVGSSTALPGASCQDVLANGGSHGNGFYWIDPAKAAGQASNPFLAYCDMTTNGGGWTLALHTAYTGGYPADPAFQETYAAWKTNGVGQVGSYQGSITSANEYVMPLESFRLLAAKASALRFESDHQPVHSELDGLTVGADYAINGSNRAQVASELCGSGAANNCFLRDNGSGTPGFSSYDVHHDHDGGACTYTNVGWWYDDCYTYNPFRTDDTGSYASNSQKDPSTRHWSWWVR